MPSGQDCFSIPELLLGAVFAANLLTLAAAAWTAPFDRRPGRMRALTLLRVLAIGDGVYFLLVLLSTLHRPDPIPAPRLGEPLCLAHRCIAIEDATRTPPAAGSGSTTYRLTLRLTNSSRYSMRDNVRAVYLVDDRGRRYPPLADPSERPLTTDLGAFQAVTTMRTFVVPADARGAGFIVDRDGGAGSRPLFRCLVIAGSCWFPAPWCRRRCWSKGPYGVRHSFSEK